MSFSEICDWIVLFGAVAVAITNIYNLLSKSNKKLKGKKDQVLKAEIKEVLKEEMPALLTKHSEEVSVERAEEHRTQLEQIREDILKETKQALDGILEVNLQQSERIAILTISSKDMLRQRIMDIYYRYRSEKSIPVHARETLNELYKDYKAEKGNSYIDKYYNRMDTWETYDDEKHDN